MTMPSTSRRRFLGIVAATSALSAAPWMMRRAIAAGDAPIASWRGIALGADAELHIFHPDRALAEDLIQRSITEVHRLENIFSLYRDDSALVRLNHAGRLTNAPTDMLRLLEASQHYSRITEGAFDPTVQSLWMLYADAIRAGHGLPSQDDIARCLQRVNYRHIIVDGRNVSFAHPGMALTFNGIAQGYITDRITELLRDAGLSHALVDMGEIRGLSRNDADRPFRVGLSGDDDNRHVLHTVEVRNRAVSTSTGQGTVLDPEGQITHLFDPLTGSGRPRYRSVSVMAGTATTADALSTAFSMMDEAQIQRVSRQMDAQVWLLRKGDTALTALV